MKEKLGLPNNSGLKELVIESVNSARQRKFSYDYEGVKWDFEGLGEEGLGSEIKDYKQDEFIKEGSLLMNKKDSNKETRVKFENLQTETDELDSKYKSKDSKIFEDFESLDEDEIDEKH